MRVTLAPLLCLKVKRASGILLLVGLLPFVPCLAPTRVGPEVRSFFTTSIVIYIPSILPQERQDTHTSSHKIHLFT